MKLAIGIFFASLLAISQCWIPFVFDSVDPRDPLYVLALKHALHLVGAPASGFNIQEYLVKDEISQSVHKVTYSNHAGEVCHITFEVNSLVGIQVPTSPICSFPATLGALQHPAYRRILQGPYYTHTYVPAK